MEALTLIIALSAILWYIVDKFKPIWEGFTQGKYITMAVAGLGAFGLTFGFNLDLINALDLVAEMSMPGQLITGFLLMSGSSAIAEIIGAVQKPKV